MERGTPEQQMAKHEWENSANENTHWQQGHATEKFRQPRILDQMWMGKLDEENRTDVEGEQEPDGM